MNDKNKRILIGFGMLYCFLIISIIISWSIINFNEWGLNYVFGFYFTYLPIPIFYIILSYYILTNILIYKKIGSLK